MSPCGRVNIFGLYSGDAGICCLIAESGQGRIEKWFINSR